MIRKLDIPKMLFQDFKGLFLRILQSKENNLSLKTQMHF